MKKIPENHKNLADYINLMEKIWEIFLIFRKIKDLVLILIFETKTTPVDKIKLV